MRKIKKVLLAVLLCAPFMALAQSQLNIAGTVYDESGETLPGASIFVKNRAGVGTTSDVDGKFKIRATKNDILVISFIGYTNIEYTVTKEETGLKFQLEPAAESIEEVVVTGLGASQRKISVVGAITTVNVNEIQTPATSIANMLGGRVPGMISMVTSGEPGKNLAEFWVRGIGTFGANASALVLIDGLEGDLNSIDPADVESFSVLKDASATAVYGSRGANGVVLVTTKRGGEGRLKITFRTNFTATHIRRMPEYLRSYDYARLSNEAHEVRGDQPLYDDNAMRYIQYNLDSDLYPDVDWQKETMKRNGFQQTYFMSAQGGTEVAKYYLSLGVNSEGAAYKMAPGSRFKTGVGYDQYNYRMNLDINMTKTTRLFFGADGWLSITKTPGQANTDAIWQAQAALTPILLPVRYSTGELPGTDGTYFSPYVMLNETGNRTSQNYHGKLTMEIKQDLSMLTEGLSIRVQGAYDNEARFDEYRTVRPELYEATGRDVNGTLQIAKRSEKVAAQYGYAQNQYRKYLFESTLNYERVFGDDHRFTGLIYYLMQDSKDTGDIGTSGVNASMAAIPKRYQALSSRLSYGFKDTYFMDVNFGYTGSENFQKGRRFGFFPSIAAGWVVTNYDFVKDNLPWLDFLKFRGSYGTVGNASISSTRFPYLTIVSENVATQWTTETNGIRESSIGADNLEWERAKKADFGIEGRLLGEKLTFTVDFFDDRRDGIFQQRQSIPDYVGLLANPYGNVGEMRSWGSDGNVAYTYEINKNMDFTVRANYTYSDNEVSNWEQAPQKYPYTEYGGYTLNSIRGYKALGLFRDEQDIASSPTQTFGGEAVAPGDIKYKDINGDGLVNSDDIIAMSTPTYPRMMYGFGGEFHYKNFRVGILFKGTGSTPYYNVGQYVNSTIGNNGMGYVPFHGGKLGNILTIAGEQKNRWTPASYSGNPATENPDAMFPRLTYGYNANNSQLSTFWKGDSKYLRLQEITLNYNLKAHFLRKVGITSVDLQAVGSNLYVWDNVKLFDPEQAQYNGLVYPIPARYTLQLYINF
ncbi:MAG: TonB-dependent receptor [Bacteroidales bacterium]|jgi:TonB-linked SusC/RagA family outer membrane protein|nr:TonB-dependent receptor [Bacteroidales bacterium]